MVRGEEAGTDDASPRFLTSLISSCKRNSQKKRARLFQCPAIKNGLDGGGASICESIKQLKLRPIIKLSLTN